MNASHIDGLQRLGGSFAADCGPMLPLERALNESMGHPNGWQRSRNGIVAAAFSCERRTVGILSFLGRGWGGRRLNQGEIAARLRSQRESRYYDVKEA